MWVLRRKEKCTARMLRLLNSLPSPFPNQICAFSQAGLSVCGACPFPVSLSPVLLWSRCPCKPSLRFSSHHAGALQSPFSPHLWFAFYLPSGPTWHPPTRGRQRSNGKVRCSPKPSLSSSVSRTKDRRSTNAPLLLRLLPPWRKQDCPGVCVPLTFSGCWCIYYHSLQ